VHYWLCGRCAGNLNLQLEPLQGLRVVPLMPGVELGDQASGPLADDAFEQTNRC